MAEGMSVSSRTAWALRRALATTGEKAGPSEGVATVRSVDSDGTVWVRLPGSTIDTPANGTVTASVAAGQSVSYRLSDGRLSVTGNATSPSVGGTYVAQAVAPVERTANDALSVAQRARDAADAAESDAARAYEAAESAVHDAEVANEAAQQALEDSADAKAAATQAAADASSAASSASSAQASATAAQGSASSAASSASQAASDAATASQQAGAATTAANEAKADAATAKQQAASAVSDASTARQAAEAATTAATNAVTQLSFVEDVAGTLDWIQDHGTFAATTDTEVDPTKVYFQLVSGDYVPVSNPAGNPSQQGWYELDVTDSQTDYIMAHLAVTSAGLWVLPSGIDGTDAQHSSGYKALLSSTGMTVYDGSGVAVATYGSSVTFADDRDWQVGSANAYVRYSATGDTLAIGGPNVSIGGNAPSDLATKAETADAIDDISIGGRNLFSSSASIDDNWKKESATVTDGVATITRAASGNSRIYQMPSRGHWTWDAGETFTVSVDACGAVGGETLRASSTNTGAVNKNFVLTTEWVRYSHTFTVVSNSTSSMAFMNVGDTDSVIYIRNPKIERGNKATDWSPAPEDLVPNPNILRSTNQNIDLVPFADTATALWSQGKWGISSGTASSGSAELVRLDDAPDGQLYGFRVWSTTTGNKDVVQSEVQDALEPSVPYQFTCYARLTPGITQSSAKAQIRLYGYATSSATTASALVTFTKTLSSTEWTRLWYVITLTKAHFENVNKVKTPLVGVSGVGDIQLCGLKLERSNYATGWAPSPFDTASATSFASMSLTVDGINTEVAKKVNGTEIISTINQSAESVKIQASKVEITGDAVFSAINNDTGTTKISGGKIDATSITIGGSSLATQSDIDAIEVGGRNLAIGTEPVKSFTKTKDASQVVAVYRPLSDYTDAVVAAGSKVTVSFEAKASETPVILTPCLTVYTSSSNTTVSSGQHNETLTTEWQRFVQVLTVSEVPNSVQLTANSYTGSSGVTFDVRRVKVETGTKATDWSPAPEDTDASISEVQDDLDKSKNWYGTCSTAAATAAKVVVCDGFKADVGVRLTVKCSTASSANVTTITVQDSDENELMAATTVHFNNAAAGSSNPIRYGANAVLHFVYDGTVWTLDEKAPSYSTTSSTAATTRSKAASMTGALVVNGTRVSVRFSTANTYVANSVQLNLASTGSMSMYSDNVVTSASHNLLWDAQTVLTFVQQNTGWHLADNGTRTMSEEAAKTATNYISIDPTNGIRIADADPATATTYQHQTATETEFVVGGDSVAEIGGSGARFGISDEPHLELTQTSMRYTGTNASDPDRFNIDNVGMFNTNPFDIAHSAVSTGLTASIAGGFTRVTPAALSVGDKNRTDESGATLVVGTNKVRVGKADTSNIMLDYHSMQLVDMDGYAYFHVSDLRGADGTTSITELFVADGSETSFTVHDVVIDTSKPWSVSLDGSDVTSSVTLNLNTVIFQAAPTRGQRVEVTYTTMLDIYKAMTFGSRNANSYVGPYSVSEGLYNISSSYESHAEGAYCTSEGQQSHAEGYHSTATGKYSHAEGYYTTATGNGSHSQNMGTNAGYSAQTTIGKYNDNQPDTAFEIGNGSSDNARSNALTVDWDGNVVAAGAPTFKGMKLIYEAGDTISGNVRCMGFVTSSTKSLRFTIPINRPIENAVTFNSMSIIPRGETGTLTTITPTSSQVTLSRSPSGIDVDYDASAAISGMTNNHAYALQVSYSFVVQS